MALLAVDGVEKEKRENAAKNAKLTANRHHQKAAMAFVSKQSKPTL